MDDDVVNRTGRPGREGLVASATRLFAERGVRGTSLQQIADAAGVTKAAVYHHFRTKDEVVEAVLEPALNAIASIVRNSSTYSDPQVRVETAIVGLADQAVQHRHLWAIVLLDTAVEQLLHGGGPHISAFHQLRALLHGPGPDERRRMMVSVFLSGLMGPALDRTSADIPDDVTREVIIEAGRRLLL